MVRYYPIYVRRSDGKQIVKEAHKLEPNEPTKEQQDRSPDAEGIVSYYHVVGLDEPKSLDWRRKIGGMLARELGHKEDPSKSYILADFPEGYRLWEHIKKAESEKVEKGGPQDRNDSYMYGHPTGPKKRFRSPHDFYHHVLWLATDESGNPRNCACKICSPTQVDEKTLKALRTTDDKTLRTNEDKAMRTIDDKPKAASTAPTTTATKSAQSTIATNSSTAAKETSAPPKVIKTEPNLKATHPSVVMTKSRPIPPPTPPPPSTGTNQTLGSASPALYNADHETDLSGPIIFRQGETVWFNRGSAWALGIILQRSKSGDGSGKWSYVVQPFSHPFDNPPRANLTGDESLRPWLAWSVPGYTNKQLNSSRPTFATADWNGILNKKYGSGDTLVDASIMAAKAVDLSYSLHSKIDTQRPKPNHVSSRYAGIYLGSEKLWKGDIARLMRNGCPAIFVISEILEDQVLSATGSVQSISIQLTGDIFVVKQVQTKDPSQPLISSADRARLPSRILNDTTLINKLTIPAKGFAITYTLTQTQCVIPPDEISGRWYESTALMPLLGPTREQAHSELVHGLLVSSKLNKRFDCMIKDVEVLGGNASRSSLAADRVAALGKAVPDGTVIQEAPATRAA